MASYAEIANDLMARAKLLDRTHQADLGMACRRGARAIRELIEAKADAEAGAEAEAQKLERYMNGEDL